MYVCKCLYQVKEISFMFPVCYLSFHGAMDVELFIIAAAPSMSWLTQHLN